MRNTNPSSRSRFLSIASILVALIGFALLVSCLVYPPAYVYRLALWGTADVANSAKRRNGTDSSKLR